MERGFINSSIRKIQAASENNKLIIFVGAGVSANSNIPTWSQLIDVFAKELGIEDWVASSTEDYLKIPQYYYNERGEKEYYDKLLEVFESKNYFPNPIHKLIFDLNPKNIITTNFDNLLEQASEEFSGFYHTVTEDIDLSYDINNRMIIKMHGDFSKKNIVLKEDDFLQYAQKFSLIEHYLKSLLATNTVLFIGYSINDPNFKLIFQWVKDVLKGHFQPAYLLECSRTPNYLEFNYYKNKGINVLYYGNFESEIRKCPNVISHELGQRLYNFLWEICQKDTDDRKDFLQIIYESLFVFDKLNYIFSEDLVETLATKNILCDISFDDYIVFEKENELIKLFREYERYEKDSRFQYIINTFKKLDVKGIKLVNDTLYEWKGVEQDKFIEDILNLNYLKSKKKVPLGLNSDCNYNEQMREAFLYYKSHHYIEAYLLLKEISKKTFKEREYILHFICNFNLVQLKTALYSMYLDGQYEEESISEIIEDINRINLHTIYNKLPNSVKKNLKSINFILNFNQDVIQRENKKLEEALTTLEKTKILIEQGGSSTNESAQEIIKISVELWKFINYNCLFTDHNAEIDTFYYKYVKGVLISYSTKEPREDKYFAPFPLYKVKEIDKLTTQIMINSIKSEDLIELMLQNKIETLKQKNEVIPYLLNIFQNLIVIDENCSIGKTNKYRESIYNTLILLTYTLIDKEKYKEIIQKYLEFNLLEKKSLDKNYLNSFIVKMFERGIYEFEVLELLLSGILDEVYNMKQIHINYNAINLLENIISIFSAEKHYITENQSIKKLINSCDKMFMDSNNSYKVILLNYLLPTYEILMGDLKEKLEHIIKQSIHVIEMSDGISYVDIELYCDSNIKDIIGSSIRINEKILSFALHTIEHEKNSQMKTYPCPIRGILIRIVKLIRKGTLNVVNLNPHVVQTFKGFEDYFDFIFDQDGFDYKKFQIDWLKYFTEHEHQEFIKDAKIKKAIQDKIEERIIKEKIIPNAEVIFPIYYLKA